MPVNTVNISFSKDLLKEADRIAKAESRSRSELVREAVRQYIDRRKRWDELFRIADQHMKGRKITEQDILNEIHAYRKERRKQA
jgi:metal-responsive CopG/Arc/MetJ family transcriptional regulator